MTAVRSVSAAVPPARDLPRLMFEAARRAEAMGILGPSLVRSDASGVRRLANKVRRAGVASSAADLLNNVEVPSDRELVEVLQTIVAALDASPVPRYEWNGLARVFAAEDLAALLDISLSSLRRYQSRQRDTPDEVAARLHYLALLVGDLAGSYNEAGIRRWFQRKRTLLEGQAPAALLRHDWDPDDPDPKRVRALARDLVELSAT